MSIPTLQKNILATLAYYDGLDYPLTAFEIYKYLISLDNQQPTTHNDFYLSNIIKELEEYNLKRLIEEHRGFYFLRGRKELVAKRIKAGKISEAKIKRLRRVVWFLRLVPYVRMIGVTGRLAAKNADHQSDWDVLVVLKSGRIWIGRTLLTTFLQLIGKRRHGQKIKDRVCLNYFITDESLELITQDLYSSGEYSRLFPIFDSGIFQKFQIQNKWIKKFRPNFELEEIGNLKTIVEIWVIRGIREIGERILDFNFLDKWLGSWQRKKIERNPKTNLPGSFIRFSDEQLVFFPEPQSAKYINQFENRLKKLGF
jgi:hypothetical protein